MGGFESATHRRRDRRRVDVLAATHHDLRAEQDYRLLQRAGIFTVRDGLRWHLIEAKPGRYDWSSFEPALLASVRTGTQVIWDLCHWGVPSGLDIFSDEFVSRFAAFAGAAAAFIGSRSSSVPVFCPINEISFWSWVGGDVGAFAPHLRGRGPELKRQLVRASAAAIRAVREVEPRARFVQAEPIIQISAAPRRPSDIPAAARHTASQYEAWDMLRGDADPELGGAPDLLDMVGVNYYWNNQWIHNGERTPPGHPLHRPLHRMLLEVWERYRRPLLITETGAEAAAEAGWLGYVAAEVRMAQRRGAQIVGICLYPVMDYPGWDNGRHCHCGLIALSEDWRTPSLREDLVAELELERSAQPAGQPTGAEPVSTR